MRLNTQPIEKKVHREDGIVEVHSIFYTIQGEGPFCGTPSVFVRLAGCNPQCPWCDTEYSSSRMEMTPFEVVVQAKVRFRLPKGGLVVITGGEPFRQNLSYLLRALTEHGYYVQIETNGTLPPPACVVYAILPPPSTARSGARWPKPAGTGCWYPKTSVAMALAWRKPP